MWGTWIDWLGDLNEIPGLTDQMVGVLCIAMSGLCGAIVGIERERRSKPAGLRTLILICVGSTVFTMASILIAEGSDDVRGGPGIWRADRARIAAQIVTGVGFLGAGAIIHARRSVVGLTTGATIWVVAAVGVVVGSGYAAAGLVLSFLILLILTLVRVFDRWMGGPCGFVVLRISYSYNHGKTRHTLLGILDDHLIDPDSYRFHELPDELAKEIGQDCLDIRYCTRHPHHRSFLPEIANLVEVEAMEEIEAAGW